MIARVKLSDGGEAIVDWSWRQDGGWYVDIESFDDAPLVDAGLTDQVVKEVEMACADHYPLAAYQNDRLGF